MITALEVDKLVKSLPKGLSGEEWRTAASVATGVSHSKTLPEIINFYHLNRELAEKWWDKFNFDDLGLAKSVPKKTKPQKVLLEYVKENIGEVVSVKSLSEECGVSFPSVYNFIDSYRGWFKKIARGRYEIIDSDKEREISKK